MRPRGIDEEVPGITAVAVLGLGFIALALGYPWFWLVWVVGFVSVVPITAILSERLAAGAEEAPAESDEAEALEVLRERYAAGEIDEAEFERQLEVLLETESVPEARDRVAEATPEDRSRAEVERDRT